MLQIDDKIVSLDLFTSKFACNLKKCRGACCVHGDSGAPLEAEETEILNQIYPEVKPFMRKEGIEAIEKQGTSVIDADMDHVTPLVNNKECAYVIFEQGIAKCAIEKAYENKAVTFRKPISCHLYPIRLTKYSKFEAVNYHRWDICNPAIKQGEAENIPIYIYLKEPLIRKYGQKWYDELKVAAPEILKWNSENLQK